MKILNTGILSLLFLVALLIPNQSLAQEEIPFFQTYQQESGVGYHIFEALNAQLQDNYTVSPYYGFFSINYAGRFTAKSFGPEAGVSVGFKGAVVLSLSSYGSQFIFNLPLMAEFNVGHAATIESTSDLGGFIGAGLDFNYMSVSGFEGTPYFFGPAVSGGARFMLRGTSNTFRISQTYDMTRNGGMILVFSLNTNIGE